MAGYQLTQPGEPADVCVINTCTVTQKAAATCRNSIRRAIKTSPNAFIIVVGCYSQLEAETLKEIEGIDLILGSNAKFSLFDHLNHLEKKRPPVIRTDNALENPEFRSPASGLFLDHTRAFLKIQDGCDAFCSYCIVPFTRGRIRSGDPARIRAQAEELVGKGYQEIVLTGAHVGCYGKDQSAEISLVALIKSLLQINGLQRLRLSSIEPQEVTSELIELVAGNPKFCPHLHIPLQSGDSDVLRKMNRAYSPQQFSASMEVIASRIPDIAIGTDVMVGFPGETEAQAENTWQFVAALPLAYLHVFNFSARKGTVAARLKNRVPDFIKKERSRRLIDLGKKIKHEFYRRFVGRQMPVLFEQMDSKQQLSGLTPNYLRVRAPGAECLLNTIVPVMLLRIEGESIQGKI